MNTSEFAEAQDVNNIKEGETLALLIEQALQYIEEHNTVVGLSAVSKWRRSGILKSVKRSKNSMFVFDKDIEFIDGTKVTVWI